MRLNKQKNLFFLLRISFFQSFWVFGKSQYMLIVWNENCNILEAKNLVIDNGCYIIIQIISSVSVWPYNHLDCYSKSLHHIINYTPIKHFFRFFTDNICDWSSCSVNHYSVTICHRNHMTLLQYFLDWFLYIYIFFFNLYFHKFLCEICLRRAVQQLYLLLA